MECLHARQEPREYHPDGRQGAEVPHPSSQQGQLSGLDDLTRRLVQSPRYPIPDDLRMDPLQVVSLTLSGVSMVTALYALR